MKKRTAWLLLAVALVFSLTGCGNETGSTEAAASGAASASTAGSAQADDTLTKLDTVNSDFDTIFTAYGSVVLHYEYVQQDLTKTIYLDSDTFIELDSDDYVLVDEDSKLYGRDSAAETDYFKAGYLDEENLQDLRNAYESIPWYTSSLLDYPAEITTQDDGTLIVTLTADVQEDEKAVLAETYSASEADIQGFEYRLEVDPDTMLIQRIVYSMDCGATGILISDMSAEYGGAKPEIPAEFEDFLNASDVRSVTFICNPGTDDEVTLEDTVRKGCSYRVYSENYNLYADADCTEPFEGSADLTQDVTIYIKPKA